MKKFYTVFLLTVTLGASYAKTIWTCDYYNKSNNKLGDITWTISNSKKTITFKDSNYNPSNYSNNNEVITLNNNNPDQFLSDVMAIKSEFSTSSTSSVELGKRKIKFSNQANPQDYDINYLLTLRDDQKPGAFAFVFSNNDEQRTYVIKHIYVYPSAKNQYSDEGFIEEKITDKQHNYTSVKKTFKLKNCNSIIS